MAPPRIERWTSKRVKREMSVACWGWWGKPVLLFPTAAADCLDYERFKLIAALQPLIDAGQIKVYSCESLTGETWLDPDATPRYRALMQARYDTFVRHELLPFIERDCEGYRGYVAAGASLGAYNSVNTAAKYPEWFSHVIGMSGTYDFDRWMNGHKDLEYYLNQPMYYLSGIPEGIQLDGIRKIRWVIATGQGRAEAPGESRRIAELLSSKGAQVDLEIWGTDCHHDWPTWRKMLPMFLGALLD